MKWPARVQQIVDTLAAGIAHSAPDEERRAATQKIAEQCRFELGPKWGWKRADPGRPLSTDVFCTREPFVGWDWSVPDGVAQFPESIDLAGQVFVEVEPKNHLGGEPLPGEVPPNPGTPQPELGELTARVKALELRVDAQQELIDEQGRQLKELWLRVARAETEIAQPLKVIGRTGDKYAHSHPVNLDVVRES